MKEVLSEKFSQDDIENYFGKQRDIRRRKKTIQTGGMQATMVTL